MFLLVMLSAINFLLTRLTGQSLRNRKLLLFCYGFAWPACQTDRSRSKTSYKQSCLPLDVLLLLRGCVQYLLFAPKRQTPDHIQALVLLLQGEWQWSERTNGTTPAPHVTPLIAQVLVQREGAGQAVELNQILCFCCFHSNYQASSEYVHLPIYELQKHPYSCVKRNTPSCYGLQFCFLANRFLL